MLLESVVAIGCLAGCVVAFGQPFASSYMILALLVFSLTFPGQPPRGTSPAAVAREVLTDGSSSWACSSCWVGPRT